MKSLPWSESIPSCGQHTLPARSPCLPAAPSPASAAHLSCCRSAQKSPIAAGSADPAPRNKNLFRFFLPQQTPVPRPRATQLQLPSSPASGRRAALAGLDLWSTTATGARRRWLSSRRGRDRRGGTEEGKEEESEVEGGKERSSGDERECPRGGAKPATREEGAYAVAVVRPRLVYYHTGPLQNRLGETTGRKPGVSPSAFPLVCRALLSLTVTCQPGSQHREGTLHYSTLLVQQ